MHKVSIHLGIDNIDSPLGGCTTHFAYKLIKSIIRNYNVEFIDYPNLVRLNPSIPYKTRGNGAIALRFNINESLIDNLVKDVINEVNNYLKEYSMKELSEANAGLAVVIGDVPSELRELYVKALTDYVPLDYVEELIRETGVNVLLPLGLRRGVVGALAAIGWLLRSDCTYELLVYRVRTSSMSRCVDEESIKLMDSELRDWVFGNYDYDVGKILVTPHGPDPVLLGIRGESPEKLVEALKLVRICEPYEGWVIFRTNQGTDSHHIERDIHHVRPYQTGCITGRVCSEPRVASGGDVLLKICSEEGGNGVYVAVFKETSLTKIAKELILNDMVKICGLFKFWDDYGTVLHVEKLSILEAIDKVIKRNPRCPRCGARLKSAGRGKGWKCIKCGLRLRNAEYEVERISRRELEGEYIPRDAAIKHLVKPKRRYGREKECTMVKPREPWFT
ncbi:MAG: DNA-binding protein [Desulfurococcales archaeon ex4484_42]|nr:MAG: DNA-binding protein [Desulfurococcales archaeon ex4484_42]